MTIMKRKLNIYRKLFAVLAVLCFTSSCTDYLTIVPPDKTTEEFYWQTKDDVNGILAKAYLNLLSADAIQRAIVWGELRADNLTYPASPDRDIKYIVEANLLEENRFCKWDRYYEAIQTANLVIDRAPQVVDRDPDFTEGDLDVVLGEMYALRALGHFYLVRAFRDIPMALEVVDKDYNMPQYTQVHPLEALNHIMADLEKAENLVMKSGNYPSAEQNCGRITKNAVLAMKADVNLWRAAFATYYEGESELVKAGDIENYYAQCIEDCQAVADNMDLEFKETQEGSKEYGKYAYNLIQNEGDVEKEGHISTVYNEIFGSKNSRESIFELQVMNANATNGFATGIFDMYGNKDKTKLLIVPKSFAPKFYEEDDLRAYSYLPITSLETGADVSGESTDIKVAKYAAKSSPASNYRTADEFDANWIVYRKTDVLLMMAEALVARPAASTEDIAKAFDIVKAVNTRSRIDTTKIENPLQLPTSAAGMLDLVLAERVRELSFEGKRWFDLVRVALREKSTNNIKFVAEKLESNSSVVKSKMSTIDGLFMPIHVDELRYNDKLVQNPAYDKEDESTEMN